MKKILSIILACVLMFASMTVFAEEAVDYVSELNKYSIIKGDPDGDMRLSDNLTRAEAVTLIVRLYGFAPETSAAATANEFSDMENHWACNSAMIAKGLRIIDETKDDTFNPDESIKSEDFIKMIICLLGYKEAAEPRGGYPVGYLINASQIGVTKGVSIATGQYIKRSEAAQLLYNSLDIPLMVLTSFGENSVVYGLLNGEGGKEFRSLRTTLEQK